MAEYVPNLGQIADWVNRHQPIQWPERALDAAIAAHDATVKAEALREAALAIRTEADEVANRPGASSVDIAVADGLYSGAEALRARADRIEADS